MKFKFLVLINEKTILILKCECWFFLQIANGNAQSMAVSAAQQQAQVAGGQTDYSKQWAE